MSAPGPAAGRMEAFFTGLLRRDPAGGSWLSKLLRAAPHGPERLGELAEAPGWVGTTAAVPAASGRLAAFEQPAMPVRELERWLIDHPDRLTWPPHAMLTAESERLRRALVRDDPPGSRPRAQERARELLRTRSALAREWWRFEPTGTLDCVLVTDRLVLTVHDVAGDHLAPASDWYPERSRLVRDLEAARQLCDDRAVPATLALSERPVPAATDEALARSLVDAAPHLDEAGRAALRAAYLGNLTWDAAAAAVESP